MNRETGGFRTIPRSASCEAGEMPAYAPAGTACSLNKIVDLSPGLKFGITKPEPDFAGFAGVTLRFKSKRFPRRVARGSVSHRGGRAILSGCSISLT